MRLAKFELNAVDGLCIAPNGTEYLLGDIHAGRPSSRQAWPVLPYLPACGLPLPRPRDHRRPWPPQPPARLSQPCQPASCLQPVSAGPGTHGAARPEEGLCA